MVEASAREPFDLEGFRRTLREARGEPVQLSEPWLTLEQLAWMAMAPVWPQFVVKHLTAESSGQRFPSSPEQTADLFKRALEEDWLKLEPAEAPWDDGDWYSMPETRRALSIEQLLQDRRGGLAFLRNELSVLATKLGQMKSLTPTGYPPALDRFVRLFGRESRTAGDILDQEVRTALQAAEVCGSVVAPMARRWIETAEPIARILGGELQVAVARAQRRLELFERRARDERSLANYTPRPALEQAFLDLLTEKADETWALHFLGGGGMGKTMLIRRITTSLAREHRLVTSRIDFDHINPDYPSRAPGLLLMSLAEDLKLDEDDSVEELLGKFSASISAAHRELEGAQRSNMNVSARVATNVAEAESLFVQVLETISGRSRVVLILDTCEELARMRPNGELPDSVVRTFELLERLHAALPSLRIVFSGRRTLASSGYGWEAEQQRKLPARPYLRRALVEGFDPVEANSFLSSYRQDGRRVAEALWPKMLKLCAIGDRYNPYDLDLYASWLTAKADDASGGRLDPEKLLTAGTHFYIRERIVRRVGFLVSPWLAHLAWLRHFDRDFLAQVMALSGRLFDSTLEEVVGLEWVDLERGAQWRLSPEGTARSLETWFVKEHIGERLERYYSEEVPAAWEAARVRLQGLVPEMVLARPWSALTPDYFELACRLLLPTPEAGYAWWSAVEEKIVRDRAWLWGIEITERIISRWDSETWANKSFPNILCAAVLATDAALRMKLRATGLVGRGSAQTVDGEVIESHWLRALLPLGELQSPQARRLRWRIWAGVVGSLRWRAAPLSEASIGELSRRFENVPEAMSLEDTGCAATEIGLIENVVEMLESVEWRNAPSPVLIAPFLERFKANVRAMTEDTGIIVSHMYLERLHRLADPSSAKDRWLLNADPALARWLEAVALDWQPPPLPMIRYFLDWWRNHGKPLERQVPSKWSDILQPETLGSRFESLDRDRLLSVMWLSTADSELPREVPSELFEESLRINLETVPVCCAHYEIPPLFAVALEIEADHGRVDAALASCYTIIQNPKLPLDLRRAAERALLRIVVKWRLRDLGVGRQTSLETSPRLEDQLLVATAAAFDGEEPDYAGRWRAAVDALLSAGFRSREGLGELEQLQLQLDQLEAGASELQGQGTGRYDSILARSLHPDWEATARVRAWALGVRDRLDVATANPRRLASLAFDEGCLLALRRPEAALRILELAVWGFSESRDVIGRFLALNARELVRRALSLPSLEGKGLLRGALYDCLGLEGAPLRSEDIRNFTVVRRPEVRSRAWWPWLARFALGAWDADPSPEAWVFAGKRNILDTRDRGLDLLPPDVRPIKRRLPHDRTAVSSGQSAAAAVEEQSAPWPGGTAGRFLHWMTNSRTLRATKTIVVNGFYAALGLAVFALAIGGTYRLTGWALRAMQLSDSPLWTWSALGGAIIAAGCLFWLLRWLFFALARVTEHAFVFTYRVGRFGSMHPGIPPPQRATFRWQTEARSPFNRAAVPWTSEVFELSKPVTEESYLERARHETSVKPEVVHDRQRFMRRLGLLMNTELYVPEDCAEEPWEAIIALRGTPDRFADTRHRFRRTSERADARNPFTNFFGGWGEPFYRGPMIIHALFGGPDGAVLRDQWLSAITDDKHFAFQDSVESQSPIRTRPRGSVGIVHVVESVVESERGLSIRPKGAKELLASELPREFPDLRIVVLQLPLRSSARRFKHDRLEAARARQFATQLFAAGVPVVVVIPSLTAVAAARALGPLIATIVRRPANGTPALMYAVRKAQEEIAEAMKLETGSQARASDTAGDGLGLNSALETAFDVCLYCRADVSLRVYLRE